MDERLIAAVTEVVNSRAKLDVLYYYHRNPYAWESLTGLAQRLHRAATDLEPAIHDLTRQGVLAARSGRGPGHDLVYNYSPQAPLSQHVSELMAAYEGDDRKEVLQTILRCDNDSRLRALARRRAVDDMRTRFVSMVTHELRTPVTVIHGILSTLSNTSRLDSTQARALVDRGLHQCDRLGSLVENLLVLSGLQTGRALELYLCEVEVPRLLAEVREYFAAGDTHPLTYHVDDDAAVVVADEYLLGQMLGELVRNAIKFSPEGGAIGVTVRRDKQRVVFVVEDEGIGMSQAQIDSVFEPFYQAEPDSSRLAGGLGIGLYMARNIAQSHGGEIWLEPRLRGLRVGFSLPVAGPGTDTANGGEA